MKKITKVTFTLVALTILGGCTTAEDRDRAARRAAMEAEQLQILDAANGDCGAIDRGLDAWYAANQPQADASDRWWSELSDGQKDALMEDHPEHMQAWGSRLRMTIACGRVDWFSDRV